MNKKIFSISIITIALLMGASLTSVVGYRSVESSGMESPLFNIRINNAIKNDGVDFTSNFIGKNKVTPIWFPQKDSTLIAFQKAVDIISKLDDFTFSRFVSKACNRLCEKNTIMEEDLLDIKELFHFVRNNPEDAKKYPFDMKKHSYTIGCPPPTFKTTPEMCFTAFVLLGLLIITFPIWFPILVLIKIMDLLTIT
jgi:hypothetical protein